MKEIIWVGDSKENLRSFPEEVKDEAGFALGEVQRGDMPDGAKPLTNLGKGISGVLEIIVDDDGETYRVVYVAKLKKGIYVLHSFHKKSKSGISIPKKDKELIIQRYKSACEQDSS